MKQLAYWVPLVSAFVLSIIKDFDSQEFMCFRWIPWSLVFLGWYKPNSNWGFFPVTPWHPGTCTASCVSKGKCIIQNEASRTVQEGDHLCWWVKKSVIFKRAVCGPGIQPSGAAPAWKGSWVWFLVKNKREVCIDFTKPES